MDTTLTPDTEHIELTFPTQENLVVHSLHSSPQMHPTFQFSSSSLSAALSDPIRPKPLPPHTPQFNSEATQLSSIELYTPNQTEQLLSSPPPREHDILS
jgi:hypothetical protein